jgi:hypothetical protein
LDKKAFALYTKIKKYFLIHQEESMQMSIFSKIISVFFLSLLNLNSYKIYSMEQKEEALENLMILIDHSQEISRRGAIKIRLDRTSEKHEMPILIFGKHLLDTLNKGSNDLIFEFEHENISGYLFFPNTYLEKKLKPEEIKNAFENLYKLGFDTNIIKLKQLEIAKRKPTLTNKKLFDTQVSFVINQLLLPQKRCIFLGGHGRAGTLIAGLEIHSAAKLFDILSRKNTQLLVVRTCYFGGQSMYTIQDYFNASTARLSTILNKPICYEKYKPSSMIIISETISDLQTRIALPNKEFTEKDFVKAFKNLKIEEKKLYALSKKHEFFASQLKTDSDSSKDAFPIEPTIFPLIRFPEKNAKFYPLNIFDKIFNIDAVEVGKRKVKIEGERVQKANIPIIIKDKSILTLFTQYISIPIHIIGRIPTVISHLSDTNDHLFKEIKTTSSEVDFLQFIYNFVNEELLETSVRHDFFLIKKIVLQKETSLQLSSFYEIVLPKTLYNILIERGPLDKFIYIFSTEKKSTPENTFKNSGINWRNDKKFKKITSEEFSQYQKNIAQISRVAGLESMGKKI